MQIIFGLAGIIGSFFLMKYRQQAGDIIGEAEWMKKIGGVYNVIIIASLIMFFWSLAYMTGTLDYLFLPIRSVVPGLQPQEPQPVF